MKKTTRTTAAPTVYHYYDSAGKLLSKIAVGDIDHGVTVTAEHIAALYESDADIQRQGWWDDKHLCKGTPTNRKTGEVLPEDKNPAYGDRSNSPETVLFPEESPESTFGDLLDRLPAAIARLQPQQRELIQQFFFERRTQKEIADAAGVTDAAIRNRLTKLKTQLRKMLEE